jgi:hypothetical protein
MTEHPHTPPVSRYAARWLCPGKVVITVDGREVPLTRDEALQLAKALLEVLQLERCH